MFTLFADMHSGGSTKLKPYEYIYIEAPEQEAEVIFYNRFGRNPNRVTCTCCGEDYSISQYDSLQRATGYDRGCRWDGKSGAFVEEADPDYAWKEYVTLEAYLAREDVLVVYANQIKPHEREGEVPPEGYVWVGD